MWTGRDRSRPIDLGAAQRRLASIGEQFAAERGFDVDDGDDAVDDLVVSPEPSRSSESSPGGRHLRGPERLPFATSSRPIRSYLVLAAVVAAIAVLLSIWVVIRSMSHPSEMTLTTQHLAPTDVATAGTGPPTDTSSSGSPVASTAAGAGPAGAAATADAAVTGQKVVVDVTGKVRRPGIVELPVGSRVVDAVKAAGGARRGVDLSSVNLARVLVDGEQIVIGYRVPAVPGAVSSAPAATSSAQPQPVNLNTATDTQLEALPGIGPVTAAAILQYRSDHGPFGSVDQLLDVSGIGDATLSDLRPYVYV